MGSRFARFAILLFTVVLTLWPYAFAWSTEAGLSGTSITSKTASESSPIRRARHDKWGLSVAYLFSQTNYSEKDLIANTGRLHGLRASASFEFPKTFAVLRLEGEFAGPSAEVNGSEVQAARTSWQREIRAVLGLPRFVAVRTLLQPYLGVADRQSRDSLSREIATSYVPAGLSMRYFASRDWSFNIATEYAAVFKGGVTSRGRLATDDSGSGFQILAGAANELDGYLFHLQPYWQRWALQKSEDTFGVQVGVDL